MSHILDAIDPSEIANSAYIDAVRVRSFAALLDANPNDAAAAKTWHKVADALHEAAMLIDLMQTQEA